VVEQVDQVGRTRHVASFARPPRNRARVLAIGADLRRLRMLRVFLDGLDVFETTAIGSVGPGLNALVGRPWAAALLVDDLCNVRADQLIETARALGCTVPVIGLVLGFNPQRTHALYQAGAAEVVSIDGSPLAPISRALARVVERQSLVDRVAELERSVDDRHPTDLETGFYPGWRFDEALALEAARSRRRGRELGLLTLDVKTVPSIDRLPPAERGVVLRRMSSLLRNALRDGDAVAHEGNGRFRIMLVDAGPMATEDMADTVRRAIKVGFDSTGLTAMVGLEILDAQGEAARLAQAAAA
jgi:GGDEF domain-containing protein